MICQECGLNFEKLNGFNRHIKKEYGHKYYYDKFMKKNDEDFCKICGKLTEFIYINYGYKNCCSKECSIKYTYKQTKKGNLKKYGVENSYQRKDVKRKIKKGCREKYNVNMPLQNKEIKQKAYNTMIKKYGAKTTFESKILFDKVKKTCKEKYGEDFKNKIYKKIKNTMLIKYGHENPLGNKKIREKRKKTMIKRYGTEHALKNIKCREKFKNTCLKKYGVEYPMQNLELFNKYQINSFIIKQFKNTDIYYQGSYEFDFLEKYYNKYDIQRGPRIKYKFNNKEKYYYSDFLISSKNLVIEIKNSYLAKRDKLILRKKEKASLNKGYDFIMIIDKDYNKFEKYI